MDNLLFDNTHNENAHIDFSDMAEYVFSNGKSESFLKKAAVINKHIMECPECYKTYSALLLLQEKAEKYASLETNGEKLFSRLLRFFFSEKNNQPIEQLVNDCMRFKVWLSFNIQNMKDLIQTSAQGFSNPHLVTVMKSATGKDGVEEVKSVIRSSLIDKDKNRVSIGMDGTLTLYFDSNVYAEGKRILILPDDEDDDPVMIELMRYDDSISYVRFEGIKPGKYTVMIEK